MTAESNCPRCGRCTRRKFQERGCILTPIWGSMRCLQQNDFRRISAGETRKYGACSANLQCSLALLVADRLIKRKNNELLTQACDQDGWPILVVPKLHAHDSARRQCIDLRFERSRSLFNIAEAAHDFAVRIENCRTITFVREPPLPGSQQWIVQFHSLQEPSHGNRFCALFKR